MQARKKLEKCNALHYRKRLFRTYWQYQRNFYAESFFDSRDSRRKQGISITHFNPKYFRTQTNLFFFFLFFVHKSQRETNLLLNYNSKLLINIKNGSTWAARNVIPPSMQKSTTTTNAHFVRNILRQHLGTHLLHPHYKYIFSSTTNITILTEKWYS